MSYTKRMLDEVRSAEEWWGIACDSKHFFNINKAMRHKCRINKRLMERHLCLYWTAISNCRKLIKERKSEETHK